MVGSFYYIGNYSVTSYIIKASKLATSHKIE